MPDIVSISTIIVIWLRTSESLYLFLILFQYKTAVKNVWQIRIKPQNESAWKASVWSVANLQASFRATSWASVFACNRINRKWRDGAACCSCEKRLAVCRTRSVSSWVGVETRHSIVSGGTVRPSLEMIQKGCWVIDPLDLAEACFMSCRR